MSKRILVIDDSSTIQKVIRIAFAPYDVRIDIAGHFVEGLNAARQLQPDLVLADASLAGVRSVRDFQRLADEARGVPLVLLYGSYDQVDEQLFREAGFTMFIRKPFESRDIVMSVKRVLGHDFARKPVTAPGATAVPSEQGRPVGQQQASTSPQTAPMASQTAPMASQTAPMASQTAPMAAPNASATSPRVLDGLLGGFAAKARTKEPSPAPTQSNEWMSSPEPEVDIPQEGDHDADTSLMDGLLAQTLTDNSRKGERAFSVDLPPYVDPSSGVRGAEEVSARMQSDLPPLPTEAVRVHQRELITKPKNPETQGFKAPNSEELSELLRPILREELGRMVAEAVDEYCEKHFPGVARDVITAEIRRLTDEKTRHLVD